MGERTESIMLGIVAAQEGKTRMDGSGGEWGEWRSERRGELAADKHVGEATKLSLCSEMARLAVLRSVLLSGARRRELASCWYQHKRYQSKAAELTANNSDRILKSPFLKETEFCEMNLTEFVWQDIEQWMSRPALVCTALLVGPTSL
jgi:hypothetical protein